MNKAELLGRATKDVILYQTSDGQSYCRFSIAVNRYVKNGENKTDFIDILVWSKMAENCARYLKKGSQVAVVGSIQTGNYTDKNGVKHQTFNVVAENVEFLTPYSKSDDNSNGATDLDNFKAVDDTLPF